MQKLPWIPNFLCALLCLLTGATTAMGQVTIKGTVYDMSKTRVLEGVSVMSTAGKGTATDVYGRYSIQVNEEDSIYFSYLNKPTMRFPVKGIANINGFDLALHVPTNVLPEVSIMGPSYKFDSAQNRQDYAKVFNFRKPGIGISSLPPGSAGVGVGLDLDEFINIFRFRRNKSMLGFQKRLIEEEQDKYVDHRFSKTLVKKITGLKSPELERFITIFKPTYEFTTLTSDYEFYFYIKKCYQQYKAGILPEKRYFGGQ